MKTDTSNCKIIMLCLIMGIGIFAAVVIHEIGHSATCSYFGYESPITLALLESSAWCDAAGTERVYVRAAGGLAAVAFLPPLCFKIVRYNDYARFFLLAGGISNLIYMPVETLLKDLYGGIVLLTPVGHTAFNGIVLVILLVAGVSITILLEVFRFKDGPLALKRLRPKRKP